MHRDTVITSARDFPRITWQVTAGYNWNRDRDRTGGFDSVRRVEAKPLRKLRDPSPSDAEQLPRRGM